MVTALAVLGIVGSALAFKAEKFSRFFVYQLQTDGTCTLLPGQYNPNPNGVTLSSIVETTQATTTTTDPAVCISTDILRQE